MLVAGIKQLPNRKSQLAMLCFETQPPRLPGSFLEEEALSTVLNA